MSTVNNKSDNGTKHNKNRGLRVCVRVTNSTYDKLNQCVDMINEDYMSRGMDIRVNKTDVIKMAVKSYSNKIAASNSRYEDIINNIEC